MANRQVDEAENGSTEPSEHHNHDRQTVDTDDNPSDIDQRDAGHSLMAEVLRWRHALPGVALAATGTTEQQARRLTEMLTDKTADSTQPAIAKACLRLVSSSDATERVTGKQFASMLTGTADRAVAESLLGNWLVPADRLAFAAEFMSKTGTEAQKKMLSELITGEQPISAMAVAPLLDVLSNRQPGYKTSTDTTLKLLLSPSNRELGENLLINVPDQKKLYMALALADKPAYLPAMKDLSTLLASPTGSASANRLLSILHRGTERDRQEVSEYLDRLSSPGQRDFTYKLMDKVGDFDQRNRLLDLSKDPKTRAAVESLVNDLASSDEQTRTTANALVRESTRVARAGTTNFNTLLKMYGAGGEERKNAGAILTGLPDDIQRFVILDMINSPKHRAAGQELARQLRNENYRDDVREFINQIPLTYKDNNIDNSGKIPTVDYQYIGSGRKMLMDMLSEPSRVTPALTMLTRMPFTHQRERLASLRNDKSTLTQSMYLHNMLMSKNPEHILAATRTLDLLSGLFINKAGRPVGGTSSTDSTPENLSAAGKRYLEMLSKPQTMQTAVKALSQLDNGNAIETLSRYLNSPGARGTANDATALLSHPTKGPLIADALSGQNEPRELRTLIDVLGSPQYSDAARQLALMPRDSRSALMQMLSSSNAGDVGLGQQLLRDLNSKDNYIIAHTLLRVPLRSDDMTTMRNLLLDDRTRPAGIVLAELMEPKEAGPLSAAPMIVQWLTSNQPGRRDVAQQTMERLIDPETRALTRHALTELPDESMLRTRLQYINDPKHRAQMQSLLPVEVPNGQ